MHTSIMCACAKADSLCPQDAVVFLCCRSVNLLSMPQARASLVQLQVASNSPVSVLNLWQSVLKPSSMVISSAAHAPLAWTTYGYWFVNQYVWHVRWTTAPLPDFTADSKYNPINLLGPSCSSKQTEDVRPLSAHVSCVGCRTCRMQ